MKKRYYIYLILVLTLYVEVKTDPIMTFFFRPLINGEKTSQKLKKPGNLAKYIVRGTIQENLVSGLLVTYGGYLTSSNDNGEIIFPRKHYSATVSIIVTEEINPIPLFENTILHWTLISEIPAKMYICEQKYDDQGMQLHWQTKEVPLPKDGVIPLSAVVIIARPKNIVMNEGQIPATETANLILPDIYVKKGNSTIESGFYILTIRHFFKVIGSKENREQLRTLAHVVG